MLENDLIWISQELLTASVRNPLKCGEKTKGVYRLNTTEKAAQNEPTQELQCYQDSAPWALPSTGPER